MPVKEKSFRIGCGRYIQGNGYIDKTGEEVRRLGRSTLVVGGRTALSITRDKIEKSISSVCEKYEITEHTGTCNEERASELAALANEKAYEVIVGVGGGVICDFAKLIGFFAKLPVINIPTSSATCAAYTPLSVVYTPDGKTVGTKHFEYEVSCVIVDTGIIAKEPIRLFLSGAFDALAKFIEIKQRIGEGCPIGLDYAYLMAEYSHKLLSCNMEKCIEDMKKGEISDELENLIFTTIAATGVISGIARGSNQTALAHKFYETARFLFPESTKPYLHGELVGVGLLLQNHFNGEAENNEHLLDIMRSHAMPHKVSDVGVDISKKTFDAFYEKISNSSAIDKTNEESCKKFRAGLEYLWNIK